ncbi:MAG: PorP/SprF family type IX secretion system membrane protein, partial [Bacteroidota bacterium]
MQQGKHILQISFILLILFVANGLNGQDVHFSQYYLSPLTLNPSETGNFNGDWRLSTNYRTQWRSIDVPFNTFSLGYDRNFFSQTSRFSGGLLVLHDQSGNARINSNRIQLSGAIHPKAGKDNFHLGLQAGIALKSFDISALTFPDQYNTGSGTFDGGLPNNEYNYNQKKNYFDMNVGVGWDRELNSSVKLKAGISLFHLNRPNESFFDSKFKVPIRKVYTISGDFKAGNNFVISPRIFVMSQVKAAEYLFGSNFKLLLGPNKIKATGIYIGSQVRTGINRNTDAVMGIVGMTFERLEIGFDYDVNVSSLQQATNKKGALEIAIIFWSGN